MWRPPTFDADGNRQPPNNWRSHFEGVYLHALRDVVLTEAELRFGMGVRRSY